MDPRLAVDPSDSRASIGATHYNTHVQNVNLSAPNELTVSYWSEMCENDLVTKHHSAFMAPGTEVSRNDRIHPVDHPLRYFSSLCVVDQELPRFPSQLHRKGSKKVLRNLRRK